MESRLPPTPVVRLTSSHCPVLICGSIDNTANITGMLSMTEESRPMTTLAWVGSPW
ncbi:hypothetical protein D3C85_1106790 [compost metagenome]